jgi:hypothetical protein
MSSRLDTGRIDAGCRRAVGGHDSRSATGRTAIPSGIGSWILDEEGHVAVFGAARNHGEMAASQTGRTNGPRILRFHAAQRTDHRHVGLR